jgi:hypothetical protein
MNAKEKATNLLNEIERQTYSYQEYAGANPTNTEIGYEAGKKCALIMIREIQNLLITDELYNPGNLAFERIDYYWEEVKKELEKL